MTATSLGKLGHSIIVILVTTHSTWRTLELIPNLLFNNHAMAFSQWCLRIFIHYIITGFVDNGLDSSCWTRCRFVWTQIADDGRWTVRNGSEIFHRDGQIWSGTERLGRRKPGTVVQGTMWCVASVWCNVVWCLLVCGVMSACLVHQCHMIWYDVMQCLPWHRLVSHMYVC